MPCMFCITRSVFANRRLPILRFRQLWRRQRRLRLLLRKCGHDFGSGDDEGERAVDDGVWLWRPRGVLGAARLPQECLVPLHFISEAFFAIANTSTRGWRRELDRSRRHGPPSLPLQPAQHGQSHLSSLERDWIICFHPGNNILTILETSTSLYSLNNEGIN